MQSFFCALFIILTKLQVALKQAGAINCVYCQGRARPSATFLRLVCQAAGAW